MYWTLEFFKVLIAYIIVMFIWPRVVFRKYLSGKSMTFRFSFCVLSQPLLISTVVLLFGVFHILYAPVIRVLFWGILLFSLLWKNPFVSRFFSVLQKLSNGTIGLKLFIIRFFEHLKFRRQLRRDKLLGILRGHRVEYATLFAVILFGMTYFLYGAFANYSYGFGDIYTHHSWIYGLIQGQAFSSGIYPEGMHAFVYVLHILFNVKVFSLLLFLAGIHTSIYFVSVYCFSKEIFNSRYTPVISIMIFLCVNHVCVDQVYSISRLQWTLPQEFALYSMFLCGGFFIRYLKSSKNEKVEGDRIRIVYWNDDLFLFFLSVAVSFSVHFYVTIMSVFLCVALAIFQLHRLFSRGKLRSLLLVGILSIVVACVPMISAYAMGTPLQGSLGWAVNVINGTDTSEEDKQQALEELREGSAGEEIIQDDDTKIESNVGQEKSTVQDDKVINPSQSILDEDKVNENVAEIKSLNVGQVLNNLKVKIFALCNGIYDYGFIMLFKDNRTQIIICLLAISSFLSFVLLIVNALFFRKSYANEYLGVILAVFVFALAYAAPDIGLIELIARSRLVSTLDILISIAVIIPIDILFTLLNIKFVRHILPYLSLGTVLAVYGLTNYFGVYRSYLYCELTRFNSAVDVTEKIINNFEPNQYTIISTTEELYQVAEYGYHEEMLSFLQRFTFENYKLPSKYLMMYVEKTPIQYAQYHFFTGPRWFARKDYYPLYSHVDSSEGDEILQSEIIIGSVEDDVVWSGNAFLNYYDLKNRTVLESKMYDFCQDFIKNYPNSTTVYYEDDNLVCYLIEQNTYRLFELSDQKE